MAKDARSVEDQAAFLERLTKSEDHSALVACTSTYACSLCTIDDDDDDDDEERYTVDQGMFCKTEAEASAAKSPRHFFCHDCIQLATTSKMLCFSPITNKAGLNSKLGEIPCLFFTENDRAGLQCSCATMDQTNLLHAVVGNPDALRAYLRMFVGIGEAAASDSAKKQLDEMRARHEATLREGEDMPRLVAEAMKTVQAALLEGLQVRCPQCDEAWFKDDACVHMTCGDTLGSGS